MRIIEKLFTTKENGVAGFLSYPERAEPGPALFLIHPKGGLGEYIKTETRKFAKLGYSTFAINVFEQLGFPEPTHIVTGSQIQAKTPDPEFTRVLTEGWRFLLKQPHVNKSPSGCLRLLHGRAHRHSFRRRHARGPRFCGLLSDGTRRTRDASETRASVGRSKEDSLPFD